MSVCLFVYLSVCCMYQPRPVSMLPLLPVHGFGCTCLGCQKISKARSERQNELMAPSGKQVTQLPSLIAQSKSLVAWIHQHDFCVVYGYFVLFQCACTLTQSCACTLTQSCACTLTQSCGCRFPFKLYINSYFFKFKTR